MLLGTLAAAADLPTVEELRQEYPYRLEMAGEGRKLRLLDLDDRMVPTAHALVIVGLPEQAELFWEAQQRRNAVSIGLWAAGGAMVVGPSLLNAVGGTSNDTVNNALTIAPTLGLLTAGSGLLVRLVVPRRNLGAWTDAEQVALALRQQATPATADQAALFEELRLHIDKYGVVRDFDGRRVRMRDLVRVADLGEVNDEYRSTRRLDKAVWVTSMGVGGGLAVFGISAGLAGVFINWLEGNGDPFVALGAGSMALGLAGVGTGLTGFILSKKRNEDPNWWFDDPELRGAVDRRDEELRRELGLEAPGAWLQIQPVIGPGYLGLNATF